MARRGGLQLLARRLEDDGDTPAKVDRGDICLHAEGYTGVHLPVSTSGPQRPLTACLLPTGTRPKGAGNRIMTGAGEFEGVDR